MLLWVRRESWQLCTAKNLPRLLERVKYGCDPWDSLHPQPQGPEASALAPRSFHAVHNMLEQMGLQVSR